MDDTLRNKLLEIPVVGWLTKLGLKIKIPGLEGLSLYDIIEMYVLGIFEGAVSYRAASIAYSFFMALFPFLLFVLNLIPFVPINGFQEQFVLTIESFLPPKTGEVIHAIIVDIAKNRYGGLLSFGFLASIVLMTNGMDAILFGFRKSVHISEVRSNVRRYMVAMGMSLVMSMVLIMSVAVFIYFELMISDLKESGWVTNDVLWLQVGKAAFFILLIFVSSAFVYKFGTKKVENQTYIPGAVLTTFLVVVSFRLFGIYVIKFSKYNELYGSIGTLLIFMVFLWLNAIILLLGFELNASINSLKLKHLNKEEEV